MEERLGEWGEERGLRKGAIVSSSPQGMTSWSSSIKICFFQAYRMHYLKKRCHGVKQYAKYVPLVNRIVFVLNRWFPNAVTITLEKTRLWNKLH